MIPDHFDDDATLRLATASTIAVSYGKLAFKTGEQKGKEKEK